MTENKGHPGEIIKKSIRPVPPRGGQGNEGANTRPSVPATTGSGDKPSRPSR